MREEFGFDEFKGPPKHGYDNIGSYDPAPQAPPKLGKPTGKPDQPERKGKH
jgi:hypothetical protein